MKNIFPFLDKKMLEDSLSISNRVEMLDICEGYCRKAYYSNDRDSMWLINKSMTMIYDIYFTVEKVYKNFTKITPFVYEALQLYETYLIEFEEEKLNSEQLNYVTTSGESYIKWLMETINTHKARKHPYYTQFIAKTADVDDLEFYFIQETTLDPRFDDVLALIQIGTTPQPKMEIASNYWDEMGNGEPEMVHTHMFSSALDYLGVNKEKIQKNITLESLVTGNLSVMLALYRHHFYKALGYYGVTEYLSPFRFKHVINGWKRNQMDVKALEYHQLHVKIDTVHAKGWFNNAIRPLIEENPENAVEVTKGALFRLNSSERYLNHLLAYGNGKREKKEVLETSLV